VVKIATHGGRSHEVGVVEVRYNFVEVIRACCDIIMVYVSKVGNPTEMLPSRVTLRSIMSHEDSDAANNAGRDLDTIQGSGCKAKWMIP
jgi:hypothetical protein